MNLNQRTDKLLEVREKKRELEAQLKEVQAEYDVLEREMIEAMKKEGLNGSRGRRATASISVLVKPKVEDWDALYKFILRHKYFHLLERRPSVSGCRELFDQGQTIPGVSQYTHENLNLKVINHDE